MKGGIIFARFMTFNQSISTSKEIQTKLTKIRIYFGWTPAQGGRTQTPKNRGFWDKKLRIFGAKGAEIFEIFRENLAKF